MINWFNHMYPYGNLHELNLDWVIDTVKRGEKEIADFIGVNTIKYANPILWNIESQYEANTVVVDGQTGNAYISVKAVPSGVHLNREEYWTQIYNYANVIDTLREQIAYNEGESTTATREYHIDDLVFINGILNRVIANMIAGDSFVVDSNVVKTTIENEIGRLRNDIDDEVNARSNADTQLQNNIDTEVTTRTNADTQLQNNIDAEVTARTNADTQLQNNIDTEVTARTNADTQLQNNIGAEVVRLEGLINPSYKRILTVGSHGCDYTTINEAITQAKTYSSPTQRTAILITSGEYHEELYIDNSGIDLIGLGMPKIISNSEYPHAPLEVYGPINVNNIYFINTKNDGNAYALHYEGQYDTTVTNCECNFTNCVFVSADNASVGIGSSANSTMRFYNCLFYNLKSYVCIYAHNLPQGSSNTQSIEFYNCELYTGGSKSVKIDNARALQNASILSPIQFTFMNCIAGDGHTNVEYNAEQNITLPYIPTQGEVVLTAQSKQNDMLGVNVNEKSYTLTRNIQIPVYGDGDTSIVQIDFDTPFNATKYYRRINSAWCNGSDISSSISINDSSINQAKIGLRINNQNVLGRYVSITMEFSLDSQFR